MKHILLLTIVLFAAACTSSTEADKPEIILGPEEGTYDYYVGLSYTGEQPMGTNHLYVIIASENDYELNGVALEIDDETVNLDYANYDGRVFYISEFYHAIEDSTKFTLTVNGEQTELTLPAVPQLELDLPQYLVEDEDVPLVWETAVDPQVIYIEGFQYNSDDEEIGIGATNLSSADRNFTIPASWLWSKSSAASRSIQVGIVNYTVQNRIAIAFSDGAYKKYNN